MDGPHRDGQMPLTALLARSIVAAQDRDLTGQHHAAARQVLIDWLGVALAGSVEPVARIVQAEFGSDTGPATVLGTGRRASIADAALINGTAGHALDYDDVQEFVGHPGAVVLPAALAVAEAVQASREQFVRAIIAGYDASRFVGTLAMPGHYDHGFHSTATICTFGAAAAAAVLMRLDVAGVENAVGLAATQAAGLKCMFGTMAKPFHAGRAASAGVTAARLAARGMTADAESLETDQGFLRTQANQSVPLDWAPPDFGESLSHLLFKYHASCYLTHSTIEAVRQMVRGHSPVPSDITNVVVRVPKGHLKVCDIAEPRTGLEAKFSLRQVTALVLGGHDTADTGTFCDRLAEDEMLIELRRRVQVVGDLDGQFGAQVTIGMANGQSLSAAADVSMASGQATEIDAALDRKFLGLARKIIGTARSAEIVRLSHEPQGLDIGELGAWFSIA